MLFRSYSSSYSMNTSSPHLPVQVNTHLTGGPNIKASISNPSTPMSYMGSTTPGSHYYSDQPMMVDRPPKRRASGFRRVRTVHDLQPRPDVLPGSRRMGADGVYLSVCIFAHLGHGMLLNSYVSYSLYGSSPQISSIHSVSAIQRSATSPPTIRAVC